MTLCFAESQNQLDCAATGWRSVCDKVDKGVLRRFGVETIFDSVFANKWTKPAAKAAASLLDGDQPAEASELCSWLAASVWVARRGGVEDEMVVVEL